METFTYRSVTKCSISFCLVLFGIAFTSSEAGQDVTENSVTLRIPELSVVPRPPGHSGRDVGFSGVLQGRSVWVFGDTFLPGKGDDGLGWRSSSWSWTTDLSSDDGIGEFNHALGDDGMALQLLPHTAAEYAYNIAHEGHNGCAAKSQCGSRRTPWPQALVTDSSGHKGILYYLNMQTGPGGAWDFRSVSSSLATWDDPDKPATRIEPPLFSDEEPDWGAAAVRVGEDIFVYACEFDGTRKPCLLARVLFAEATKRASYRFWAGDGNWSVDWRDAVSIFDGGSLFSVHLNGYLGKYVAFYASGLDEPFKMRTSDSPQGPWSGPVSIGEGVPAEENWNYALIAHPEFQREDGRVEVLSYTNPSGFLTQETRLVEVHIE